MLSCQNARTPADDRPPAIELIAVARSLLNASSSAAWLVDRGGRILAANAAASSSEIDPARREHERVTASLFDRLPPQRASVLKAKMDEAIRTSKPVRFETQQENRLVEYSARPVFNDREIGIALAIYESDITDRLQTEEALRQKQHFIERIADATPNIIYIYDLAEQRNVYVNCAVFNILGYTSEQIQAMGGRLFPTVLHPEDLANLPARLQQLGDREDGEILEHEYRMRNASGEWRWLMSRDTVFTRNPDGTPKQVLGTAQDITERKQVLEALRSSQQMLRLVMDNIPQAIFWKDTNSVFLGCNRKFAEDVGVGCAENPIGKTDWDLPCTKEQAEAYRDWDRRVMAADTPAYHIIEPLRRADGQQIWLDTNKVPLHDASGRVVGILGTYEDITDRLRVEEQLRASEERFRLLVEGVKDYAIYMLDPIGRVQSWNAGAERIKGYRAAEIIGAHFSCFYEPEEREWGKPDRQLQACAVAGRFEDEGWRMRKDGSRFWASVVMTALRDEAGQLRGFAQVVRDISDRRQAEEALHRANQQLGINVGERASELKIAIEQLHQEISQRARVEAQLRKSERQYRSVVDNLKEVIFQTDEVGSWVFLNPAWTEITGFAVEESLGKLFLDFVHPDDRQRNIELFKPLIEGQKDYCRHEIRYLTKEGKSCWLEVFVRLTRDDEGYITGTAGTLNDITDRVQALTALRESEERFRRAFEDVATGMALVGLDGRFLQVNRALCEMLGYLESELTAMTVANVTHPDDLPVSLEVHRRVQSGEERYQQVESRYLHKDGHAVWAQMTISLVRDAAGEPLYYVSKIQDITDRVQAEAALRESETRFRQLAENVDEVFWILAPDRRQMLYVSPMYEQIWGRKRAQLYREPFSWLDAVHPEDRERVRAAVELSDRKLAESPSLETLANEEYRIIRPDGSVRWIWDRSFPVRNEAGEVYRICGVAKDITGRKHAEEELCKALAKEKELSELRSRFVTMVSHEFRTPLATILSSADLLQYYLEQGPRDRQDDKKLQHLDRIQTATVHINQMLNDVLVIGKADAGKLEFNPAPIDLTAFCRDLTEEMQISALHTHSISFVSETLPGAPPLQGTGRSHFSPSFAPPLSPSSPTPPLPWMDEKLLRHILSNLLSNALKYSPKGGNIEFKLAYQENMALFEIRDPGIGIPPEDQQRLFEAFHRARNVGDIPGTGLGLAIVKRAVDIHGGQIAVKSEVGAGTTFTVALPVFPSAEAIPGNAPPLPELQSTTPNTCLPDRVISQLEST